MQLRPNLLNIVTRFLSRNRTLIRRPPMIEVRRARHAGQRKKGWAEHGTRRIVVYTHPLWPGITEEITLVHELVHLSGGRGCWGHRAGFRRALARAAGDVWGIDVDGEKHRTVADLERALWWARARQLLGEWVARTLDAAKSRLARVTSTCTGQ